MAKEQEILQSEVRLDGVGEDPIIQALVSDEYTTAPDEAVVDINLALQQLLRGQASLLAQASENTEEINRLKEKFAGYDEASARWETDRIAFLEDVSRKAEKLIATGERKEQIEAHSAQLHQDAHKQAAANRSSNRLKLDQMLATQPKVKIRDPGIPKMTRQGKSYKMMLEAETITIGHRRFVFPPNREIEVPLLVAEEYNKKKGRRAQVDERKQAAALNADGTMGPQHEQGELAKTIKKIDEKYKTQTEAFPLR